MCGRMTLTRRDLEEVADELEAVAAPELAAGWRPRFNVAPTDRHPLLRSRPDGGRELVGAVWGLDPPGPPGKARLPPLINARAETAAAKASFREAFARRRCVIPADGFFEWQGAGAARRPFWLRPPDGGLLRFAGLWDERGGQLRFTILTTAANRVLAALHDRMPVLLAPQQVTAWLRDGSPALLQPAPEGALVLSPVSPRVNSVKNDDPGCLLPDRQLGLFPL